MEIESDSFLWLLQVPFLSKMVSEHNLQSLTTIPWFRSSALAKAENTGLFALVGDRFESIDVERKIVRGITGKVSRILSSNGLLPKGERLILGENSSTYL